MADDAETDTADAAELARFSGLARTMWDPFGPMAPLHKLNPVRIAWVRDRAVERLGGLSGLRVLDVGCGAGLLAEPLARLGAKVTAVDASGAMIEAAVAHAAATGTSVSYRVATAEALLAEPTRFDLVVASEVVEHVRDPVFFTACLAALARGGGLVVLTTVSRTLESLLGAKLAAEYLLGWLPPGTHDWRRFLTPSELARHLRNAGLRPTDLAGMRYDAAKDRFALGRAVSANYLVAAVKD